MELRTTQIDGYAGYPLRASVESGTFSKTHATAECQNRVPKTKSLLVLLLRCML